MQHPDEGTIHTWLDGALDNAQAVEVEAHVAQCATCAAAVAEARGLIAASSRILNALDDVPSGVIPKRVAPPVVKPARRQWRAAPWVTGIAAAALMFAIGITQLGRDSKSAFEGQTVQATVPTDTAAAGPPSATASLPAAQTAVGSSGITDASINARTSSAGGKAAGPSRPERATRRDGVANLAETRQTKSLERDEAALRPLAPAAAAPVAASPEPKLEVAKSATAAPALERVVVTGGRDMAKNEQPDVARFAGCYQLAMQTTQQRDAVSGAASAVGRAAAPQARAAEAPALSYSAAVPRGIIRLDTVQQPLGYPVRAEYSDTSIVGWWRRVGNDTADIRLLQGVAFKVTDRNRVNCSER
jgi:anti-sigma factor RsiW